MPGPLAGYRILEMTTIIMGPMASMVLSEMGAEVVKVEAPNGDQTRYYAQAKNFGMGAIFLNLNKNKRSIVLDLKAPDGRDALLRLMRDADVLLYSIRPQAMARLGLTYDDCRRVKPDLVYCGAFGFRQDGPYAARPAYDDIIQGLSGTVANLGWVTGEPRYMPAMPCDKTSGLYVANAVLAALLHRERTGEGQRVDVPMFETNTHFNLMEHFADMIYQPPVGEAGYVRAKLPHRRPHKTRDGHICLLAGSVKHWRAFFGAIGRPELADDERVTDPAVRYRATGELYALIGELVADWNTADLLEALQKVDVPCAPVNDFGDLPDDPHLKAIGFFRTDEHPTQGTIRYPDLPVQFHGSPGGPRRPAPELGQHSVEILREAGYSDEDIARLLRDGVTVAQAADGTDG